MMAAAPAAGYAGRDVGPRPSRRRDLEHEDGTVSTVPPVFVPLGACESHDGQRPAGRTSSLSRRRAAPASGRWCSVALDTTATNDFRPRGWGGTSRGTTSPSRPGTGHAALYASGSWRTSVPSANRLLRIDRQAIVRQICSSRPPCTELAYLRRAAMPAEPILRGAESAIGRLSVQCGIALYN
jgi:hypothetical protein